MAISRGPPVDPRTGAYARPGTAPIGDPVALELLETQKQILAVERERLDLERSKMAIARFPEVEDIERGAVRIKLTQMVDAVAIVRGSCSARVWRELYAAIKSINGIDLYAQTSAARQLGDRVTSIIQCIESRGLIDMVYATARRYYMDDIVAKPVKKRVPRLRLTEPLPTDEMREAEETLAFMMGRTPESRGLN